MDQAVIVQGEIVGYRATADNGLRVTIELDEFQTAKFHEGFAMRLLVAVARLNDKPKEDG